MIRVNYITQKLCENVFSHENLNLPKAFKPIFTEKRRFLKKRADFCSNIPLGRQFEFHTAQLCFLFGKDSIYQGIFRQKMRF